MICFDNNLGMKNIPVHLTLCFYRGKSTIRHERYMSALLQRGIEFLNKSVPHILVANRSYMFV